MGRNKGYSRERKNGHLAVLGVWVKVIYEQMNSPSAEMKQLIDANVAIDAHLWGAIAGTSFYALTLIFAQLSKRFEPKS